MRRAKPARVRAGEVTPGDCVVCPSGLIAQVTRVWLSDSADALVGFDFADGSSELFESSASLPLLNPKPAPPPTSPQESQ